MEFRTNHEKPTFFDDFFHEFQLGHNTAETTHNINTVFDECDATKLVELSLKLGVGCGLGTLRGPSPHLASSLSLSPTSALIAANIQLATILN